MPAYVHNTSVLGASTNWKYGTWWVNSTHAWSGRVYVYLCVQSQAGMCAELRMASNPTHESVRFETEFFFEGLSIMLIWITGSLELVECRWCNRSLSTRWISYPYLMSEVDGLSGTFLSIWLLYVLTSWRGPSTRGQQRLLVRKSIVAEAMGWKYPASIVCVGQRLTWRERRPCSVVTQRK